MDLRRLMEEHDGLLARIIEFEGSALTNDPADPGGLTHYGITFRTWDAEDGVLGDDTIDDFRRMTLPQARAFYAANFLTPFAWLVAEWPVSYQDRAVFCALVDYAIHSSPKTAACALQAAIGAKVDGAIGPKSRAAWAALNEAERDLAWRKVIAMRLVHMGQQISDQAIDGVPAAKLRHAKDKAKYCEGWMRRMAHQLILPVP